LAFPRSAIADYFLVLGAIMPAWYTQLDPVTV
jgi:hypothetical protein